MTKHSSIMPVKNSVNEANCVSDNSRKMSDACENLIILDDKIEIYITSDDDNKQSSSLNNSDHSDDEINEEKSNLDISRHSWHANDDKSRVNLSIDDLELSSLFAPNSPLQMRAVSSPSLSENPIDLMKNDEITKQSNNEQLANKNERNNQHVSESVLQKFKKTLSQFKTAKHPTQAQQTSITNIQPENTESKHRFGPLIWRTSKERRKTKTHRRDKCNSGDSGIQVELENDENLHDGSDSVEATPAMNVTVRRANSAKLSSSSLLKHKLSLKNNNENPANISRLSGKSLSQPSGLDCIVKGVLDISDTDSEASQPDIDIEGHIYAEVLFNFRPGGPQELGLEKGALVEIVRREPGPWWFGRMKHDAVLDEDKPEQSGWFPKDFVKIIPSYQKPKSILLNNNNNNEQPINKDTDSKDCDIKIAQNLSNLVTTSTTTTTTSTSPSSTIASSQQSSEQMKDNIIKELLETEINYVKLLSSLCSGFIKTLKEKEEIFSSESINIIFSNLEKIWRFQQTFLDALRIAIPNHRIGEVFLEYQSAFMVYSTYCNSYPRALMELENYTGNKEAINILENCRIAQNLPELPLSAHLLAPIQRICRYPLHLSELVKHSMTRKELLPSLNLKNCTKSEADTIDCKETFEVALAAMKRVTEMVNEGKRHSEYLSRIQARFENFQGPSINVHSTRLFLQTDAIRMSPNLWNNTYTLFLFDRQLVYCKKDLLKRTNYIYKGRIFLDTCRILNLPDGKMFGVTLKNALRLYCDTRNKWFDFCFRSSSSKLRFLNTISAERQFCGKSLFVSELAGTNMDDDNLSDREFYQCTDDLHEGCSITDTDHIERGIDMTDNMQVLLGNVSQKESTAKLNKFSDTLPKKSRKLSKETQHVEYNSNSLGRRKIGNWFRKAKSTNSTPSQSPTHHPLALSLVAVNNSDSSSQSSPGLGYQQRQQQQQQPNNDSSKGKVKEGLMTTSSTS